MRIALNLASRPFADQGPVLKMLRIAMGVLALLSLLLALGIHLFHQKAEEARARDHSLDGQIAVLNQERLGRQQFMQRPENAQLLAHVVILNQLFDEKAFSWTLAMEDLEHVLPSGVQAVTLEPLRGKDGHITLRLRVAGPRDKAVELVRNLEHSRYFILPAIIGESAESTGGPNQKMEPISPSNRVNFDVIATYNLDAIADRVPQRKSEGKTAEEKPGKPTAPPPVKKIAKPVAGSSQPSPSNQGAANVHKTQQGGAR